MQPKTFSSDHRVLFFWIVLFLGGCLIPLPSLSAQTKESTSSASGLKASTEETFIIPQYELPELISERPSPVQMGGFLKETFSYGPQKPDPQLAKARSTLFVVMKSQMDSRFNFQASGKAFYDLAYAIKGRDHFSKQVLDENESQLELKELTIDGPLSDHLAIKLGRQIDPFGESEFAQIVDIVNPRDLSQPGLISLEDARLPVVSARLSLFSRLFSLDLIRIFEIRGHKLASKGSDFDFLASRRNLDFLIEPNQEPDSSFENGETVVRLSRSYNGGDLRFVFGDVHDDTPVLMLDRTTHNNGTTTYHLQGKHQRMKVIAISASKVKGSALFKVEAGTQLNKAIPKKLSGSQLPEGLTFKKERDVVKAMVGMEYSGWGNLDLTFEVLLDHIIDHDRSLDPEALETSILVNAGYTMLNERLQYELNWIHQVTDRSNIYRGSVSYELTDNLKVEGGAIFYEPGSKDSDLSPYDAQDRYFFTIKKSF